MIGLLYIRTEILQDEKRISYSLRKTPIFLKSAEQNIISGEASGIEKVRFPFVVITVHFIDWNLDLRTYGKINEKQYRYNIKEK